MLKKLTIRNFKAIEDMTIEFTPLTVLIGENGCGKTTILQALDFLRSAASRDIPEYLREKDWDFSDLKSQLNNGGNKSIEFVSEFEFKNGSNIDNVTWFLFIDMKEGKYKTRELISINDKGIIAYSNIPLVNDTLVVPEIPNPFKTIKLESSLLKIMDMSSIDDYFIDNSFYGKEEYKTIIQLKEFLLMSINFDLLSPDKMRSGNKLLYAQSIGTGGEVLNYCIHKMNDSEKEYLSKVVYSLFGSFVEILTFDRGNKVELLVKIKTDENTTAVETTHISDGLLRIIAFAVISMKQETPTSECVNLYVSEPDNEIYDKNDTHKKSVILLDEIENGINPYITEKIIELFRDIIKNQNRQVITTTHSPVILNDFAPGEIVFLWKDKRGSVHSRKFFDTEEMSKALGFLNPGEIWENFGKEKILEKLDVKPEYR